MFARIVQAALMTSTIVLIGETSSLAAAAVRVLILSNGGDHDTAPELRRILKETGRFDVRICESPVNLAARTLADFDVLVDNYSGPTLGKETDDAISGFVESGKGLVVTNVALGRSAPVYWPAKLKSGPVSDVHFLDVKLARPKHPIVSGTNGFRTADAIPDGISTSPSAEVIAVAIESGNAIPVVTASDHGKGRIVCLTLGHDSAAIHEKEFAAIFAKSTEWAATAAVTVTADVSQTKTVAVKALLITGGHDHDAEFYKLFDGYKEFDQLPVDTSTNAFKKDLRGKFDVVIMYDFSRDLDEAGKKNLRDFVESGGGIVVLHHALLNYQNWDWWDDEVVGGSYRLTNPSSSVKNDQQIYVTPTENHPITAGIAPFHIQDEAYKNLRMSPKIRPLLTTDNPTSDTNLAWVGPLKGTRVVAIQLGHGTSAFRHPSYRALVHNAVLWAAGKTN
jgi:type 1 glutamine amidotransferase